MALFDRKDVIPVVVLIAVAIAAVIGIAIFLDQSTGVHAAQNPERIPFTSQEVTPGDSESYVGTYGQCPFYENAGAKGCVVPSDITCNADWSVCTPKDDTTPILDSQSPPAASPAVKVSNCKE